MNWLTSYVRPKMNKAISAKDIPDHLWTTCPKCGQMIFNKSLEKSYFVCTGCNYHFRLSPQQRFSLLFDGGKYTTIHLPKVKTDPLHFTDLKKYTDRLKKGEKDTKQEDAIVVATGLIGKYPAVVGVFNFDFMGGSMGTAVGEAIITAVELAILQEAALILVPASGGARMQEGILSLMQMPRTVLALQKLKDKGLPYIALLSDPTTGGVTASFAMLGDVALAEPGALIGFAGARVIEQTIHAKLPDGFQRSEYLMQHGMIDDVVERKKLRKKLINIIGLLLDTKKSV